MKNIKNAMKVATFCGVAFTAFTMPAVADYKFSVKVKNNTDHLLTNVKGYWTAKGSNNQKNCWRDSQGISKNKSYQRVCGSTANSKKWQRRIKIRFNCPNYMVNSSNPAGSKVKYFPAANKYFARDHAINKKDTYTVTIKNSDCFLPPAE
ncbi:MAG: hypothetical protein ACJ0Q3_07525 [Candidatus Azotimanducaceae bacterium]